jgi:predicted secreted protein
MDPVTMAAVIGAGTTLVSGLLSSKAQKEEEKRRRLAEAQQQGFQMQADAQKQHTAGAQTAFQQLMEGYGKAFL